MYRYTCSIIYFDERCNIYEELSIQPPQLNQLTFAALDGGRRDAKALESLWRQYAQISTK